MPAAQSTAQLTQYPPDDLRMGRGISIAIFLHLFVATMVCLIMYILGIQSLKELLEKGGAIASSGPAPEQPMIIDLKLDDIKPPPTDQIEFMQQILKPKPEPVIPKPPPKPIPKPVVKIQPKFTAPKATGSGNSNTVSAFVLGSSGLPHPNYPYQALAAHEGGTVDMHVVFDGSGGISSAEVTGSSGYSILDASTRTFIYSNWKNAGMANRTVNVPIVYDPSGTVH